MTDITQSDIENIVAQSMGGSISEPQFALLGNFATKAIEVSDSDQSGLVYVHGLGDDKSSSFPAFKAIEFRNFFGRPVEVVKTKFGYKIVGLAPEDATFSSGIEASSQLPVVREQIIFGGILPTEPASAKVQITKAIYRVDNQHYVTSDAESGNLLDGSTNDTSAASIDLPTTSGQAILVMVQINPSDGAITYKQTAEYNASLTISQITLPTPDSGKFLCGYVKLIKGITSLTFDNVMNTPDILTLSASSGGASELSDLSDIGTSTPTNRYALMGDGTDFDSRALVEADISDLGSYITASSSDTLTNKTFDANGTGNSLSNVDLTADITGTLPVANGGTGSTTASGARSNLSAQETISGATLTSATVASTDKVLIQDVSDSDNLKTITAQSIADLASGGSGDLPYLLAEYGGAIDSDVALRDQAFAGYGSDVCTGGTASSSQGTAANGFDGDTETKVVSSSLPFTIKYDFGASNEKMITKYTLYGGSNASRQPTAWTFEGSNNDSDWDVLDTQTGQTIGLATTDYTFSNSTAYRYCRINISNNGGDTETRLGELEMMESVAGADGDDKLAQSFEVTGTQTVASADLWLKKVGSPAGTMTLRIETDNSGEPSGTLADANLTTTLAESGLGTSYADATFTFSTPASISGSTTYWLVLSTDRAASLANHVIWGADSSEGYADGKMQSEISSTWSDENKDAIFTIYGEGEQTLFQKATATGTYTTTSTTPVEISDMSVTFTSNGRPCVIELISASIGSTGTSDTLHSLGVNIDGDYKDVVLARTTNVNTDNDYPANFSYTTLLPAGSHTITLAYKKVSGSNTVLSYMNTAIFSVRLT